MFILLKLVTPLFLPPALIAIGMAISLYLFGKGRSRGGRILLTLTLVSFYLLSTSPVTFLLARSLARTLPRVDREQFSGVEAIVILAGGMSRKGPGPARPELREASWRRLWRGIELYRQLNKKVPIIYSGGSGAPFDPVAREADLAREYALSIGIPASDFWTESLSRNTYENGTETRRLLDGRFPHQSPHRVALVTSSIHMPRSLLVMKRAGLAAIPVPADFAAGELRITPLSFIPSAGNFCLSTSCFHEWLGIIGYQLLGRL